MTFVRSTPRTSGLWLLFALCIFAALFGRLAYLARPFSSDGAMFIYMGKLVSEGGRFCHDLIDNKFPSVGLMTSVWWRAFGATWWPYVVGQTVLSLTGSILLVRIVRRHVAEYAAVPTLLASLVFLNLGSAVFGGFQLETLQLFFAILVANAGLDAVRDDRPAISFTAGLAAGCAAMLKPTGLAALLAVGVIMVLQYWRRPMRLVEHLAAMGAGLAIPAAGFLIYLVQSDTLRDMPALYLQISAYARNSAWIGDDIIKPITICVFIGFPLVVRGWIFRRHPIERARGAARQVAILAIVWLLAEFLGVVAQRRMYAYHFLVLAPPAVLLYGMIPRRQMVKEMAASLIPLAIFSVYGGATVIEYEYRHTSRLPVSDYLIAHASPSDAVWQDDAARLWLETGLRPGSRHPITFLFTNWDTAPLEYGENILTDFRQRRPRYIVLQTDLVKYVNHQTQYCAELERIALRRHNYIIAWLRIERYVRENYRVEAYVGRETIYRLRDVH